MKLSPGKLKMEPLKWEKVMVKSAPMCNHLPSVAVAVPPTLINSEKEITWPKGRFAGSNERVRETEAARRRCSNGFSTLRLIDC